jgi:hypothetical protein
MRGIFSFVVFTAASGTFPTRRDEAGAVAAFFLCRTPHPPYVWHPSRGCIDGSRHVSAVAGHANLIP